MIGTGSLIRISDQFDPILIDEVEVGMTILDPLTRVRHAVREVERVGADSCQHDFWLIGESYLSPRMPSSDCVVSGDQEILYVRRGKKIPTVEVAQARSIGVRWAQQIVSYRLQFDRSVHIDCSGLLLVIERPAVRRMPSSWRVQ